MAFDLQFQSSPAPKGGSHTVQRREAGNGWLVSILSRPEGREPQGDPDDPLERGSAVSILSRPEGREPRAGACSPSGSPHSFNPLPPRRAGATTVLARRALRQAVSILSRPEGREPQTRRSASYRQVDVSILSRPEGREPRQTLLARRQRLWRRVSILSRPEGREPRVELSAWTQTRHRRFQSSPAPKGGSHAQTASYCCAGIWRFNPLPPRRAGATPSSVPNPRSARSFNPLPPRRAGATFRLLWPLRKCSRFN